MNYKHEELLGEDRESVDVRAAVVEGTHQGLTDVARWTVVGVIAGIAGYLVLGKQGMKKFVSKVR